MAIAGCTDLFETRAVLCYTGNDTDHRIFG